MAANAFSADEEIIDLTELIETGDAKKNASSPSNSSGHDDFEDMLSGERGDSGGDSDHLVDADEQLDMSAMGDIDNLLESLDIPAQPGSAPVKEAPARQAASAKPAAPQAAPKKQASAADSSFADLDSVLDDLLGDPLDAPKPDKAAETGQPTAPAAEPASMPDLDSDLDNILMEAEQAAPAPENSQPDVRETPLAEDVSQDVAPEPPRHPTVKETADFLDDFVGVPKAPQGDGETGAAISRTVPPASPVGDVLQVQTSQQSYSPELIAGICGNVLTSQANATQESLRDFSHRLGSQSAHVEDLIRQVEDLNKRLRASEAMLSSAKARIAALEKSQERAVGIEDLLREGSPLHLGFMSLLSSAVSQALSAAMPRPDDAQDLRERLSSLEMRNSALAAATENQEKRLDSLESKFNEKVESAAAQAVVKILHEEIGKLAAEGNL